MAVGDARCDRNGKQPDDGRYGQREPDCSRVEPLGGKPDCQERHLHAENHAERRIKECKSPRKRRGCGCLGMSGHESDCDSCSIVLIVNTHEHHAGRTVRLLSTISPLPAEESDYCHDDWSTNSARWRSTFGDAGSADFMVNAAAAAQRSAGAAQGLD